MKSILVRLFFLVAIGSGCPSLFADWPTYMKDSNRSGVSTDAFIPTNGPAWIFNAGNPPSASFYPKTLERGYNLGQQTHITPTSTFDYAYAPIIAGGNCYFGSSTDQAVYCLDAKTGVKKWSFFTEGAVRFAPVVEKGEIYFGADDGYVYCLDAATGKMVWKRNASPENRRIIANGKVASQWPIRTSVIVYNGTVYFSAGLFPAAGGVYLMALKADTGAVLWKTETLSPSQGYILAAEGMLFVPNGRQAPTQYKQTDGSSVAPNAFMRGTGGGAFVSMLDDMVMYGPSEFGIYYFRTSNAENPADVGKIASPRAMRGKITGLTGWRAARQGEVALFLKDDEVVALPYAAFKKTVVNSADSYEARLTANSLGIAHGVQRIDEKIAQDEISQAAKWKGKIKGGRSLIIAGNLVVVGGDGEVKGFDLVGGKERFSYPVDGTAWELAADGGLLFASTSSGRIYCFGQAAKATGEIKAVAENVFADAGQARFKALAELAVKNTGRTKGFCLIAGVGEGRLAYEIVKASEMQVVCVEKNPAVAAKARENLVKAGVYGRAVVHVSEDGKLPYVDYFANLVTSESFLTSGKLDFSGEEIYKVLQPYGGALILASSGGLNARGSFPAISNWTGEKVANLDVAVHHRGPLPDAGEWSHMFANPQNTNCSGDRLIKGADYLVQWFGDPSPAESVGWHQDGMGPLAKNGKLVNIKAFSVESVDAYNGTSLWYKWLPEVTRLNVAREGGSGCLDDNNLYLAVKNDCQVFDLVSGKKLASYLGPDEKNDWGYIAVVGDILFGTKQNPNATFGASGNKKDPNEQFKSLWYASEGDFVVSQSLFALNKNTGAMLWNYSRRDAVILNTSITMGDRMAYWVESRNPKVVADANGSVWLGDFFANNNFLVAADMKTGKVVWEIPYQSKARTIFYLSYYKGMLIEMGPYFVGPLADNRGTSGASALKKNEGGGGGKKGQEPTTLYYSFRVLDASNGKLKWESGYQSGQGGQIGHQHNFNIGHPVFAGDFIYNFPPEQLFAKISLAKGEVKENPGLRREKGCATPTGAEYTMFFRSMGIAGVELTSENKFYVSDANRPSCWMSILPACGVILMPEYSFGCMCGFPLQTSIVMVPHKLADPIKVKRDASAKSHDARNERD